MIQANKATILTDFNLESVSVQFMEIEFFLLVFGRITKIASLLAGFASAALLQTARANPESPRLHLIHVLATGGAFGFMLLVLLIATFCSMWGPGLALRGCGMQSVSKAVEMMDWAQQATLMFLKVGLWCFLSSSLISACLFQPPLASVVLVAILVTSMFHLHATERTIRKQLLPKGLTRGVIKGNPLAKPRCYPVAEGGSKEAAADRGAETPEMFYPCYENHPTSASSTAETLRMPMCSTARTPEAAAYAPEPRPNSPIAYHQHYEQQQQQTTSHSSSQRAQEQQQRQDANQGELTFRQMASSAYTSAVENLASFVGLIGEDIEGEHSEPHCHR